ncbi:hypothetical protein C8R43DRAFT_1133675 [Mycena crocata]|nr:hypothetical protein C8R43DRAFT_1133675 [Mycena crocata]
MASEPPAEILLSGPLFIGVLLNWALLGALVTQLYDYHTYFKNSDRPAVKFLVYFVSTVEFLQTAFITHTVWEQLVATRDPAALRSSPWSAATTPILNGIVSACVQGFFAWRIWLFETKYIGRVIAVIIVMIAFMQLSASIAVSVIFTLISRDITNLARLTRAAQVWLAGSFVCDLIIAIAMVIILLKARLETHSASTSSMLNNLIVNTLETGAITAVLALAQLILYQLFPRIYLHIAIEFVLGRLYCNVLLAALNGRGRRRARAANERFDLSSINFNHETEADGGFTAGRRKRGAVGNRREIGNREVADATAAAGTTTDEVWLK